MTGRSNIKSSFWSRKAQLCTLLIVGIMLGTVVAQGAPPKAGGITEELDNISWSITELEKPQLLTSCIQFGTAKTASEVGKVELDLAGVKIDLLPLGVHNDKESAKEYCFFMCSCNLWKKLRELKDSADVKDKLIGKVVKKLSVTYASGVSGDKAVVHLGSGSAKFGGGIDEEFKAKSPALSLIYAESATNCSTSTDIAAVAPFSTTDDSIPACGPFNAFSDAKYNSKEQKGVGLFREPASITFADVENAKKNDPTEFTVKCSGAPLAGFVTKFAVVVAALSAIARFGF